MILADALQFSIRWSNEIPLQEKGGGFVSLPMCGFVAQLELKFFPFSALCFCNF